MVKLYGIEYNNGEPYEDNYSVLDKTIYEKETDAEQAIYDKGYTVKVIREIVENNRIKKRETRYESKNDEDCSTFNIVELELNSKYEDYDNFTRDELIETVIELEEELGLE